MKVTRHRSPRRTSKTTAAKKLQRRDVATPELATPQPSAPLPSATSPTKNVARELQQRSTQSPLHTQLQQRAPTDKTRAEALLRSVLEPALFASTVHETNAIVARRVDLRGAFHPANVERGSTATSLCSAPPGGTRAPSSRVGGS